MNALRKFAFGLIATGAVLGVSLGGATLAQAHDYGWGGYYHGPSVHYHRTYHADYLHWTPYRGWHTHGHYHVTPHYVPGHFHW
jgi:hypothetical protein